MMKLKIFFMAVFFGLVIYSCGHEKKKWPQPINPNGDTELALLMRAMFDDALLMKEQIENGKIPKIVRGFEEIHTAKATEPDKVASAIYTKFANDYLESVQMLKEANLGQTSAAFNSLVQRCMNCHQAMCPGPMVRIEKLWVEL